MSLKRGIYVAPFDELVEPSTLAELARGDGRLTLGVGLGSDRNGELEPFGEVVDPRERACLLDERLEQLSALPWAAAGATWVLTSIDSPPRLSETRASGR